MSLFMLEKRARHGDSVSAYLFILVLENVFITIKPNQNIQPINIFDHYFLYTTYTDDTYQKQRLCNRTIKYF